MCKFRIVVGALVVFSLAVAVPVGGVSALPTAGDSTSEPEPGSHGDAGRYGSSCVFSFEGVEGVTSVTWADNPRIWARCYMEVVDVFESMPAHPSRAQVITDSGTLSTGSGQCFTHTYHAGSEEITETFGDGSGLVEFSVSVDRTVSCGPASSLNVQRIEWCPVASTSDPTSCASAQPGGLKENLVSMGFDSWSHVSWSAWPSAFPPHHYGGAYVAPFACETIDVGFEVSRHLEADFYGDPEYGDYESFDPIGSAGVAADGDRVRITLDSESELEVGDIFEFKARFSASDSFDQRTQIAYGVSVLPASWVVERDGPPVEFDGFEIYCDPGADGSVSGTNWFYLQGEWSTVQGSNPCRSATFSIDKWADPVWILGSETPGLSFEGGDTFQIAVDYDGTLSEELTISWRSEPVAPFQLVGKVGAVAVFPVYFEGVLDDDREPFRYEDLEVQCKPFGGDPDFWTPGTGHGTDPGSPASTSGEEGCYSSSGMTLTKPWTWVSGAGRMGVCLARVVVVPDGEAVQGSMDGFIAELEEQFPFSMIFAAVEFLADVGSELESAGGSGCWSGAASWQFGDATVSGGDVCVGGLEIGSPARAKVLVLMLAPMVFGLLRHTWSVVLGGSKGRDDE